MFIKELEVLARSYGVAVVVIMPDATPSKPRRQRERTARPTTRRPTTRPSHGIHLDEVQRWLEKHNVCFAWMHEVHHEDWRNGLTVPDMSERFIQYLPEHQQIPAESFAYMRANLSRMKAIGALPRPRWDAATKQRVRVLRRLHSDWDVAYQLRNETGYRFTSGTIKGVCRRMRLD